MKGGTPIEREIRQAAQREEELRREKGGVPLVSPVTPSIVSKWNGPRPDVLPNDSRDVQHRIATSRIQLEIQEATQREKELLAAGKIQTISEDTVDSKVILKTIGNGFYGSCYFYPETLFFIVL